MEQIEASVLGTIYRNDDNGYSVLSVRKGRSEITVTGVLPYLNPGENCTFTGQWTEHPQYGKQFKAVSCEVIMPTALRDIEKYLGSGAIKGVGPKTARDIVDYFGEETLTVLSEQPERLQEVPHMGRKRWMIIAESFQERQMTRQGMIYLQHFGVSASLALKISKIFGEKTQEIIQQNPYRLCREVEGIGFLTADQIALSIGISKESEFRIQSAILYVLQEGALSAGHIYLPQSLLVERCAILLKVEPDLIQRQLGQLTIQHDIALRQNEDEDDPKVYLPKYDQAEKEVAQRLCELMAALSPVRQPDTEGKIDLFERRHQISFSKRQREAITMALEHGVLVITGGPGTGKTTIINCIITLLSEENEVMLCAPTGRAAKRMSETTGIEAKTIHRLLEFGGDAESGTFSRNLENPLDGDCIIVDETSMVDLMLMRSLLRAIEPGTRLILVGDADQLPSVGAGNVLGDILQSGAVTKIQLTDIYRQEESSRIVVNAHRIIHGEMPLLNEKGTDFFFERKDNYQAASQSIVQLVTQRLPSFLKYSEEEKLALSARNIQVLAAPKKGECGVINLNHLLQEALNPPSRKKPAFTYGDTIFRIGDKVIQTKNDYEQTWRRQTSVGWEDGSGVFNGDVGTIIHVDPEDHGVTVLFDDDKEAAYDSSGLENLDLAYCLSVHKSQGSEFPVVVIPVIGIPSMLATRNLFYTALTRAKNLVVLVGQEGVIAQLVKNDHIAHRYTTLAQRLKETAGLMLKP